MLVVLSPQDMTDSTGTAEKIVQMAKNYHKPVLASWMGGDAIKKGSEILSHGGIPVFEYPDYAASTFAKMWSYSQNLQRLYEMPQLQTIFSGEAAKRHSERVKEIIDRACFEKRTLLDEFESKQILEEYQIPIVQTVIAHTADEAAALADR